MAYSKIFHKKKNLRYFFLEYFEISKYEISDLTTRMVLAKGKKKKKKLPHLTVSLFNSLTDLTTHINLKTLSISLFLVDAV